MMGDLLALAILAKFLFDVRAGLDASTFVLAAAALALAAGLGGTRLLSRPLRLAAFFIWIIQEVQRQPNFSILYGGLLGALILAFLLGRLVGWSTWRIPAAALLVLVALGLFARFAVRNS